MNCYCFGMGGHGDIIYSLPSTKILGDGIYWFNGEFSSKIIDNIGPLLMQQPHVKGVKFGPLDATMYDTFYDMNVLWKQPDLANVILPINFARALNIGNFILEYPYITLSNMERRIENPYVIIGRTPRYRNPAIDWRVVIESILNTTSHEIYFNGHEGEYNDFISAYGYGDVISRLKCDNFLDIAEYVCGAEAIYCNQTSLLTVAQGLGKDYFLEKEPNHMNCVWNIPEETILTMK